MPGLYTGKGDGGTTKFFGCPPGQPSRTGDQKRVSKSSSVAEALGNLDELNSFLGVVKVHPKSSEFSVSNLRFSEIVESIQQNLFTICAHIAGADKNLTEEKIKNIEEIIAECEKELPPITTFTIAGGTELSALFDFGRTVARRAERRVVAVNDSYFAEASQGQELKQVSPEILKYINRLSSILFALARLTNHRSGIKESAPSYN